MPGKTKTIPKKGNTKTNNPIRYKLDLTVDMHIDKKNEVENKLKINKSKL